MLKFLSKTHLEWSNLISCDILSKSSLKIKNISVLVIFILTNSKFVRSIEMILKILRIWDEDSVNHFDAFFDVM